MVQMPGNQHMMGRTMLPHGPPNMANHVPGTQQAHSPNYPQQIGRPSSRPTTPSQGVITNPSPSMANRLPPGAAQSMNEINTELMRIPSAHLPRIKQELMIAPDRDLSNMTADEKVRSFLSASLLIHSLSPASDCGPLSSQVPCTSPTRTGGPTAAAEPSWTLLDTSHGACKRS